MSQAGYDDRRPSHGPPVYVSSSSLSYWSHWLSLFWSPPSLSTSPITSIKKISLSISGSVFAPAAACSCPLPFSLLRRFSSLTLPFRRQFSSGHRTKSCLHERMTPPSCPPNVLVRDWWMRGQVSLEKLRMHPLVFIFDTSHHICTPPSSKTCMPPFVFSCPPHCTFPSPHRASGKVKISVYCCSCRPQARNLNKESRPALGLSKLGDIQKREKATVAADMDDNDLLFHFQSPSPTGRSSSSNSLGAIPAQYSTIAQCPSPSLHPTLQPTFLSLYRTLPSPPPRQLASPSTWRS